MTHIPRAVCVGCGREMKTKKTGRTVQAMASFGPYYKVQADEVGCNLCGYRILTGFAHDPIQHFEPSFEDEHYDLEFVFDGERYSDSDEEKLVEAIRVIENHIKILENKKKYAERKLTLLYEDRHADS